MFLYHAEEDLADIGAENLIEEWIKSDKFVVTPLYYSGVTFYSSLLAGLLSFRDALYGPLALLNSFCRHDRSESHWGNNHWMPFDKSFRIFQIHCTCLPLSHNNLIKLSLSMIPKSNHYRDPWIKISQLLGGKLWNRLRGKQNQRQVSEGFFIRISHLKGPALRGCNGLMVTSLFGLTDRQTFFQLTPACTCARICLYITRYLGICSLVFTDIL